MSKPPSLSMRWDKPEVYVPVLATIAVAFLCWFVCYGKIVHVYEGMRPALFTGFFTLSGFLLTAKTFIVLNMKKEVYSTKTYLRTIRDFRNSFDREANESERKKAALEIYRPLKSMGDILTTNVGATLFTALLQFSVGLLPFVSAATICLSVAAGATALLSFSLYFMWKNLDYMYQHFEKEAEELIAQNKLDE